MMQFCDTFSEELKLLSLGIKKLFNGNTKKRTKKHIRFYCIKIESSVL